MKKFLSILMAMALIFALAIPCFASESEELGIPNPSTVWVDSSFPHAFIVESDTSYSLYLIPFAVDGNTSQNLVAPAGYRRYDLLNGIWTLAVNSGGSGSAVRLSNLVWASYSINAYVDDYDGDGNLDKGVYYTYNPNFFPNPLYHQVQKVTTETLTKETLPTMGGTIQILILCGVGLMALLVVLSLFGKRSLIFRG